MQRVITKSTEQITTEENIFKMEFELFNTKTVPLKDSNLIEASAGTGKTYSLAILVLRLIIESKIPIKEILMVTFTKAAVAELEERIRLFVRTAYKLSLQQDEADETIKDVVKQAQKKYGTEKVQQLLKDAVLFLDETSVLTIHSFCQQTLTQFAFETNQLFGADTLKEDSTLLEEEVDDFWRKNITTLPKELLAFLINANLSRDSITKVVEQHLKGKLNVHFEKGKEYEYCDEDHQRIISELKVLKKKFTDLEDQIILYLKNNKDLLNSQLRARSRTDKFPYDLFNNLQKLKKHIIKERKTGYVSAVFEEALKNCDTCSEAEEAVKSETIKVVNDIYCQAITSVSKGIEEYKQRNNLLSFDDMIFNLHKALHSDNKQKLIEALQAKYKAVFIDEFQDTDKLQYEVFNAAFGDNTILFYIGDPKQSIYGWRKADIFTYFKAQENVKHLYHMNENFRSSKRLIEAMNSFFLPEADFKTFAFEGKDQAITYIPVNSPKGSNIGELTYDNEPEVPITIFEHRKKDDICVGVAANIIEFLSNKKYQLPDGTGSRKIRPADIGILVRSKKDGESIKVTLAAYGIPAVTINDEKVLCSDEAMYMLYLLSAIEQPSPSAINKALLSPFTGYTTTEILQLNDEKNIELFRKYKTTWEDNGIYTALSQFAADYNVKQVLLQHNTENGERIITNFYQLMELVHKVQNQKQFTATELISWFRRGIEGMVTEGDEYEQRVESDEEAIKIVTIHSAKGLEYNIVFAPFLDFLEKKKAKKTDTMYVSFRHPETHDYWSVEKDEATPVQTEWIRQQNEQENRRLLYVAITRAVYKCFISKNLSNKGGYNHNISTLAQFTDSCKENPHALIAFCTAPTIPDGYRYGEAVRWKPAKLAKPIDFKLQQENWIRMSYTRLAATHEITAKARAGAISDSYGQFIFNQLERGAITGNMLHYIFENITFSSNRNHAYFLAEAIKRYAPKQKDMYTPHLLQLLQHALNTPLPFNGATFLLSDVNEEHRMQEFEFDFNVPLFDTGKLNLLSDENIQVDVNKSELEGIMNGKIDIFFMHKEKYYILDWKSNYLGDSLEDYNAAHLAEAMNENNYHLQYLLYTVAVKKYLHSRLPSFNYEKHFGGVIYLFVRGIRNGANTGVFTCKPSVEQIKKLESLFEYAH